MCGIAGCYQQAGRGVAGPDDERSNRPSRPGRRRPVLVPRRRPGRRPSRAPSAVDHRPLEPAADQPCRKDGLTLCLQRRALQLPGAADRARSAHGVSFAHVSDTEVVLEAWRRWGPDAAATASGDVRLRVLRRARPARCSLARDQLGIKPLHYLPRKDGVVFASELKALLAAVGHELQHRPGRAGRLDALLLGARPERCAFQGVQKLPPGTWAEFRPDGTLDRSRTGRSPRWRPTAAAGPPADLREVIEESVTAHMVADVPVSTFLSRRPRLEHHHGAGQAVRRRHRRLHDHLPPRGPPRWRRCRTTPIYARKVAEQFGIKLHEIEIAPDIVELLPRIVDILDEPIGDPAAINTLLMCEAARDAGVKVLLSGMGADELFGGYRKHLACVMAAQYQRVAGARRRRARRVRRRPRSRSRPAAAGCATPGGPSGSWTSPSCPRQAAFRRSYTPLRPAGPRRPRQPRARPVRRRRHDRARRHLRRQRAAAIT